MPRRVSPRHELGERGAQGKWGWGIISIVKAPCIGSLEAVCGSGNMCC